MGEKIYFGDIPLSVLEVQGHSRAMVEVEGNKYEITDRQGTEVMQGVYISCGMPKNAREGGVALPRFVIDAPIDLVILREELYDRARARGRKPAPARVSDPPAHHQPSTQGRYRA